MIPSVRERPGIDLLRLPVIGSFLRWRHARTFLQATCFALALLVILDGLFGPQLAPGNLAGVLPWVHWRGFVVLALLAAGNLFCMACPFMLPRRLAKRFFPASRRWPAALRSKWLAVGLLLVYFWAYEAFSIWASPWLTAWVILTFFTLAFVVDAAFRGAAFCKHVCPIGQFHFVNGMISPTEVRVRDAEVCGSCATKDCIRGRYREGLGKVRAEAQPAWAGPLQLDPGLDLALPRDGWEAEAQPGRRPAAAPGRAAGRIGLVQSGCELALFQPRKVGNMDCTFCLECIHACPHHNVGIGLRSPIRELVVDPPRSGIGRFSRRPDLAALAAVLVFAAFFNAFGMVEPVHALKGWLSRTLSLSHEPLALAVLLGIGLLLVPAGLLVATAAASRVLAGGRDRLLDRISVYVWALIPLGMGMWTAHYLYHLLTGGLTIVPVLQQYLADLGLPSGGEPRRGMGLLLPERWILPVEIVFLQGGLLLTLVAAFGIAFREEGDRRRAGRAFLPWAALATVLALVGIWLLVQPMEMRGT